MIKSTIPIYLYHRVAQDKHKYHSVCLSLWFWQMSSTMIQVLLEVSATKRFVTKCFLMLGIVGLCT